MADQERPKKVGSLFRLRAWRDSALRRIGFKVHAKPEERVEDFYIYNKIMRSLPIGAIKRVNQEMVKAELDWDGFEGGEQEGSAGYLKKKAMELYSEFEKGDKYKIESSLGPYINEESLSNEYYWSDSGTGYILGTKDPNEYSFPDEVGIPINLRASGGPADFNAKFHLPPEKMITHGDLQYKIAYFGTRQSPYWDQLKSDIRKICDDALANLPSDSMIVNNIGTIRSKFEQLVDVLQKSMQDFENQQRGSLGGGDGDGGVRRLHKNLSRLRTEVMKKRLNHRQVYYTHTYRVIKKLDDLGRLFDEEGKVVAQLPPGFQRPEEQGPGLDENGYPLEVGDGDTPFDTGAPLPKNKVLIDIFEGRTPREVPEKLVEDCDLLDVAVWVYVSYDAYRDDLRDGRYHQGKEQNEGAITVMENIMTELKKLDIRRQKLKITQPSSLTDKWSVDPQWWLDIRRGIHSKVRIILNKLPRAMTGASLRPGSDPGYIESTIKPSPMNPAFDLRAPEKHRHIGRKYYYDLQENIFRNQSEEPTLTSRGAALYILHRVIEETKFWGGTGDPSRAGVIEVLEAIGDEEKGIAGYDIGANIGVQLAPEIAVKSWGHKLPTNPFKPKR